MAFKVFQSGKKQIKVTDEFLIYDKDKFVHLSDLLVLRMIGQENTSYFLLGQPDPNLWMSYLTVKADALIEELLNNDLVEVVEKKVVSGSSAAKKSGQIHFEDGMSLCWYFVSEGNFIYFKNEEGRVGYRYLPLEYFSRYFVLLEERTYPPVGEKNPYVVKFNPWEDLTRHFELSEKHFELVGPVTTRLRNESPFKYDPGKVFAGCVLAAAIAFVLFFLFLLFAS